jgi:DNA polymerase III epsilon subunit family exonuclease
VKKQRKTTLFHRKMGISRYSEITIGETILDNYKKPFKGTLPLPQTHTSLDELTFSIVDTETCGLWKGSRMVEIAVVQSKGGEITKKKEWLVNPEMMIPPDAGKVHGITDKEVSSQPTAGIVLPDFLKTVEGTILIAHNAPYDEGIISTNSARYQLWLPPLPFIDTLPFARTFIPELPSYSLSNLAKSLKLPQQGAHRALDDATTTTYLLHHLIEKLKTISEDNFKHISRYGNMMRLGKSAHPIENYPPQFFFLKMAMATRADFEINYKKDSYPITIPATIICGFNHRGHDYIEVRDHRNRKQLKTLRLDKIQGFYPI